jgi:hypothetical protein
MPIESPTRSCPAYWQLQATRCQRLSRSCMDLTTARDLRLMAEEYFMEASRLRESSTRERKTAIEKGKAMFTAEQYRAKAAEYDALLGAAQSPAEAAEYRHLKQNYASLAENLDWLAANAGKTVGSGAHAPT